MSELFTAWGPMVAVISWSSIILQMCFPMMLLRRPTRIIALFGIGSFHVGIAVLMGLPWFSLAMIAIDAIFIRDVTWARFSRLLGSSWAAARSGDQSPERIVAPIKREDSEQLAAESDEKQPVEQLVR